MRHLFDQLSQHSRVTQKYASSRLSPLEVDYRTADDEENFWIAQANAKLTTEQRIRGRARAGSLSG